MEFNNKTIESRDELINLFSENGAFFQYVVECRFKGNIEEINIDSHDIVHLCWDVSSYLRHHVDIGSYKVDPELELLFVPVLSMSSECPTVLTFVLGNINDISAVRALMDDYGRLARPNLIDYSINDLEHNLHVQEKLIHGEMIVDLIESGICLIPKKLWQYCGTGQLVGINI